MNKKGLLIWLILPKLLILFTAAILVTWQITYNYVHKSMDEKYTAMLADVTAASDISRTLYNVDSIVRGKYIGTVDDEKLIDSTIAGYIAGLGDKYAYYMDALEYDEYLLENTGGVKTGMNDGAVGFGSAAADVLLFFHNTNGEIVSGKFTCTGASRDAGTNDHYIIHSFSSLKEPCRSYIISDVFSAWLSSLTFNL